MTVVYLSSYCILSAALLLALVRLFKGPDTLNRILAFDLICVCIIGVVGVYSLQWDTLYYLEMILIFCLLGFTSTLAFMDNRFRRLLERGETDD